MACNKNAETGKRLSFLDNLKTFIIFLVVFFHVGWVYERSGVLSTVWIIDDPSKNDLAGLLNLILDMFMMPTMFFISGYFTPLSLKSKKGLEFLKFRFKRLMVPWIISVISLIPLYKVIFLYSRDLPQESVISYFHFSGGVLINQGWLWFLPVMFMFDVIYFALVKTVPVNLKISLKVAVVWIFMIGSSYSYIMSSYHLYGWTHSVLLDFQNERLLIYFLTFLLGSLAFKQGVFNTEPKSKLGYYIACGTIWIPMNVYVVFLINLIFNPGQYIISGSIDLVLIWSSFNLSMLGMIYLLICTFRYYFNKTGSIMRRVNSYSYGVYIIHFVVFGGIALILIDSTASSIFKYITVTLTTFVMSNLIIFVYRSVLQQMSK